MQPTNQLKMPKSTVTHDLAPNGQPLVRLRLARQVGKIRYYPDNSAAKTFLAFFHIMTPSEIRHKRYVRKTLPLKAISLIEQLGFAVEIVEYIEFDEAEAEEAAEMAETAENQPKPDEIVESQSGESAAA